MWKCIELERDLFALPARLGGLSLLKPCESAVHPNICPTWITTPLTNAIIDQNTIYTSNIYNEQPTAKQSTHHRISRQLMNTPANKLKSKVKNDTLRAINLASEKGAFSWLTAHSIEDHSFALHKGAFKDVLSLCYDWLPTNLPIDAFATSLSP